MLINLDSVTKTINFKGNILYIHTDDYNWEKGGNANIPAYGIVNDAFALRLLNEGEAANFSLTTKWRKKINGQIQLDSNYRDKFIYINEGIVELKHDVNSVIFPPEKR